MKSKAFLYWIPIYVICAIIFYFSSVSITPSLFVLNSSDIPMHFFVYLILSLFTFIAMSKTNIFKKNPVLYTIIFVLLFSVSDEIHQSLVPGRIAELKDILTNFSSSLFFVAIKTIIV